MLQRGSLVGTLFITAWLVGFVPCAARTGVQPVHGSVVGNPPSLFSANVFGRSFLPITCSTPQFGPRKRVDGNRRPELRRLVEGLKLSCKMIGLAPRRVQTK
jgi:hypothetical protein